MKFGMRSRSVAELVLEVGAVAEDPERGGEEAGGRLPAGGEQVDGDSHHVVDLGERAVGECCGGESGHDVVARLAPAVLDVGGELLVEILEWGVRRQRRS